MNIVGNHQYYYLVCLVIRVDFRERHWRGIHDAILQHHTKLGTSPVVTRASRKDGVTLYVEVAFNIVIDELVRVLGVVASARDITQRYLAQCAALKAEAELHSNRPGSGAAVAYSAESITPFILD